MNQYKFLINGPVYDKPVSYLQNFMGSTIDIVRIIVTGVCLIALAILAIKYFWGTPGVKAEKKTDLLEYMMGIFIFLGITNIIPFIAELLDSVFALL